MQLKLTAHLLQGCFGNFLGGIDFGLFDHYGDCDVIAENGV